MRQVLLDTAARIFQGGCAKADLDAAEAGEFPAKLWRTLCDNGFHLMALPDSGVELGDAFRVLRVAGRFAPPLPLAEALLANRWLDEQGDSLNVLGRWVGKEALGGRGGALGEAGDAAASRATAGTEVFVEVPWGRAAQRVVGVAANGSLLAGSPSEVRPGTNLAGEPRDLVCTGALEPLARGEPVHALLALSRVALSAGALERVLELGVGYVQEREQFGRPLAKFQAVQHLLAAAAAEVAAAGRAADAAIEAVGAARFDLEVAAAKARVGEAVGLVVEAVHQVHGAIGFTHEHQLHHFTRRLWAWRDEFGGETHWQVKLGRRICELGADQLWDFLATQS